jgi:hypothetical protein
MQHLEGSGTPVLYIGRTVLKVNSYHEVTLQFETWFEILVVQFFSFFLVFTQTMLKLTVLKLICKIS